MTVIEETEGGYKKTETSDGRTIYQEPDGSFTNQQAFAASKGQEQYEQVQDPETGEIESRISEDQIERLEETVPGRDPTLSPQAAQKLLEDRQFRNVVYAGMDYSGGSNVFVELAVWNVNTEPDTPVDHEDLIDRWYPQAKDIAARQIAVIDELGEPRGIEENEPIDPDEVRPVEKPIGKVRAAVVIRNKSLGKAYGYYIEDIVDRDWTEPPVGTRKAGQAPVDWVNL